MQSPKRKQEGVKTSHSAPLNCEIQEVDSFTLLENKTIKVETNKGTPKRSILSPVLTNIYMHYVLSL